jgi:hypothetical protein
MDVSGQIVLCLNTDFPRSFSLISMVIQTIKTYILWKWDSVYISNQPIVKYEIRSAKHYVDS